MKHLISKVGAYEHFMDPIEWFMVLASTSPNPPPAQHYRFCMMADYNCAFYCTIFLSEMTVFFIATSLVHIFRPWLLQLSSD